jgi:hypothetical protein
MPACDACAADVGDRWALDTALLAGMHAMRREAAAGRQCGKVRRAPGIAVNGRPRFSLLTMEASKPAL